VKRYVDLGHFFWKLLEDYHEKIDNYYVLIYLPCTTVPNATVYFPDKYQMTISGDHVSFYTPLKANQNLIIRLDSPESCYPYATKKDCKCCPDDGWADSSGNWLVTIIIIIVVVLVLIIFILIGIYSKGKGSRSGSNYYGFSSHSHGHSGGGGSSGPGGGGFSGAH